MRLLRSLRDAIVEDPEDLGLRRAYADLLLERGDMRGEFIHLQLAGAPEAELLLVRYATHWMLPVRPGDGNVRFVRGFIEEWTGTAYTVLHRGSRIARAVPLRKLSVNHATWQTGELVRCKALLGLRELELRGLSARPLEALASAAFLRLERLVLEGDRRVWLGWLGGLLGAPWFPRLRELDLQLPLDPRDCEMLGMPLRALESLSVQCGVPSTEAPRLELLRVSDLLDDTRLGELVGGAPRLELLALTRSPLSDALARQLCDSRSLQRVRLQEVQASRAAKAMLRERFGELSAT